MKTIANEIKAQYFFLYAYQYVNSNKGLCKLRDAEFIESLEWIELTSIENISNEDAINVFNIIGISTHLSDESKIVQCKELFATNNFYTKQTNISASGYLKAFNYLQSKGYALPYLDYSVNDLIELNVIKTK